MKACILGCGGPALTPRERAYFREADPYGFILFERNCHSPDQLRALVADLRDAVGRRAPVLVDQEGGRVQRLRPPAWRRYPPAGLFGALMEENVPVAVELVGLTAQLIANDLRNGPDIDVNCAPVLDLRLDGAHGIIGDRAFSSEADQVALLGTSWIGGLKAGGVVPVMKHLPGHGRASCDSHLSLPVIDTPAEELAYNDFMTFRMVGGQHPGLPGMTGHLLFPGIDPHLPVTLSPVLLEELVRGYIGLTGLLISDDLSMKALEGPLADRAAAACRAGCDVALHCNGRFEEMVSVADAVPVLAGAARERAVALMEDAETLRAGAEQVDARELEEKITAAVRTMADV